VAVRVEVTTLCVLAERNTAVRDISWNVLHALGIQGGLEFRGRETITITGIDQAWLKRLQMLIQRYNIKLLSELNATYVCV
jgi:hypothetical protein